MKTTLETSEDENYTRNECSSHQMSRESAETDWYAETEDKADMTPQSSNFTRF